MIFFFLDSEYHNDTQSALKPDPQVFFHLIIFIHLLPIYIYTYDFFIFFFFQHRQSYSIQFVTRFTILGKINFVHFLYASDFPFSNMFETIRYFSRFILMFFFFSNMSLYNSSACAYNVTIREKEDPRVSKTRVGTPRTKWYKNTRIRVTISSLLHISVTSINGSCNTSQYTVK